jgi:hypothetical protein
MAEITTRDTYVDVLLTQISIGYSNPDYVANLIAPVVPVNLRTGFIPNYVQSHWFRNTAARRATGTMSQRGSFQLDNTRTYACQRASFGFEIADEVRDSTVEPYNMDRDGTIFATDRVLMEQELDFVSNLFVQGIWVDEIGGTDFVQFNDYASSTPLLVLTVAQDNIEGRVGREGNWAVMGKQVFTVLRWHPDLLDTIKYTQRAIVTEELMASLFGLERLVIGRGIYTASPEGTPEASVVYQRIWGKNVLVIYRPAEPSLITPAAAYNFVWNRVPNASTYMRRFREENREIDVLESNTYHDFRVTSARSGEFLANAIA